MHCREEKTGLRIEKIFSPLLLLIFSFSLINAQINLKGFGKVEFQTTAIGNSKIYAYDYSEDGINDFILYGAPEKRVILHPSEKSIYSKLPVNKFFFYPITEIKKFNKSGNTQTHLFISRSERKAGLFSFTKYGTMQLLNEIEFDSYPQGISTGNIDSDKNLEAVVFGANFNGITLLKQNDLKLESEKVIEENSYSAAELVDLDYDGIKDLAALNLIENSIELYFTDPAGQFEFSRSISELEKINNFIVDDFDGDHFKDLILYESDGVKIFLGDSVSSFSNSIFLDKIKNAGKCVLFDINSDGWKDFLYFDTKTNLLSAQFVVDSKLSGKITLHKFENIRDIIYSKDKLGRKFVILDDDGTLVDLGYLTSLSQTEKLMLGADISALYVKDFFNKGRRDLYFIDNYDRQLKCLVFDKQKLNSYYFSFPMPKKFDNLIGFSTVNSIDLLAYNLDDFLIQSIRVEASDSSFQLTPIFTAGEIRAVKTFGGVDKKIAVIEKTDSSNQMNIDTAVKNIWNKTLSINIPFDFYSAAIIDTANFIYFEYKENNAVLTKAEFAQNKITTTIISKFDIADSIIVPQKFIGKNEKFITSVVFSDGVLKIDNYQVSKSKNEHKEIDLKSFNLSPQLSFYFYKGKNAEYIFVNDTEKENLLIFKKASGTKKYIPSKAVESIVCNGYFAASLFNNREYLVYIDKLTKTINFTGIDDEN